MSREREVLDLIADAVLVTDDQSVQVLEANAAAVRLLGYAREELIGKSLVELSAEPDASLAAFFRREDSIPLRTYRRKDGSTVCLEITTRYGEWNGRKAHIATYRDISARLQTERALKESEERFRELVENLGVGACIVDPRECFLFANEAALRTFGAPQGLAGRNLAEFTDPDELAKMQAETQKRREGRKSEYTARIRRPDGEERVLSIIATPQFDSSGTFSGTFGLFEDVTEQVRLQQTLQRERNLLLTLINNLPDHIYLRNREDRFILANRAVAEFMGAQDPDELEGKRDSDFYPPDIAAQFEADDRRILEEGKSIINQERCDTSASGQKRWVLTTKVPLFDESGGVIGLVGIGRDFTDSRQTKEELRRSQEQLQQGLKMEAIGRLAGGIAHDFNNLLTVIKGFADLVDARLAGGDPSKAEIAEISRASERAAKLTTQLLAFGRKQILQPRIISLNDVVLSMRAMLRRILGEDIELSVVLDPGAGAILADQGQLEQVVMNLSVNARDAMPRGGRLTISMENRIPDEGMLRRHPEIRKGEYVALAVSDTGVGMDGATLARIFEPFFTTKEVGKGTGLGLSTVYGIVKQSGGYIYCDSLPGRGTTFSIYFPRVAPEGRGEPAESPAVPRRPGSETVLLVEDEAALRGFIRSTLQRNGYTVVEAPDGISALGLLESGRSPFDVLLTDVVMPRMGGHDLARQVLRASPGTRVLFMSGYAEESIMPGPVDLIRKPFDAAALLSRLREVLDRP